MATTNSAHQTNSTNYGGYIGGSLGASSPAASLLQYWLREYPHFKKVIEETPEVANILSHLKPGDIGLQGFQTWDDKTTLQTKLLQGGSAGISGSGGVHGTVAGGFHVPPNKLYELSNIYTQTTGVPPASTEDALRMLADVERPYYQRIYHGGWHPSYLKKNISGSGGYDKTVNWLLSQLAGIRAGATKFRATKSLNAAGSRYSHTVQRMLDRFNKGREQLDIVGVNKPFSGKTTYKDVADTTVGLMNRIKKHNQGSMFFRHIDPTSADTIADLATAHGARPYSLLGAAKAGLTKLLAPTNRFTQALGGCATNPSELHCGSLPALAAKAVGTPHRYNSSTLNLPAEIYHNPAFKAIGVVNKAKVLEDLALASKLRTGLGVGASLGLGGLGYLAGSAAQWGGSKASKGLAALKRLGGSTAIT